MITLIDGANIVFEAFMLASMLGLASLIGCALVIADDVLSVVGFFLDRRQ